MTFNWFLYKLVNRPGRIPRHLHVRRSVLHLSSLHTCLPTKSWRTLPGEPQARADTQCKYTAHSPYWPVETNFYEIPEDPPSMNDRWPKMITSSNYVYLIDGTEQLHILDISNPASPTKVNPSDQKVEDIALNNGYVYLLSPSNLKIGQGEIGFAHDSRLDILDSAALSLIGVYRLPAENPTLGEVLIAGDRAYFLGCSLFARLYD